MNAIEILTDAFSRIREAAHQVLDGIGQAALEHRVDADANTISWLIWHLSRVQDDHVAEVAGTEQVWTALGWFIRFGLDIDAHRLGYGDSSANVADIHGLSATQLRGYFDDVSNATAEYLETLQDDDLDRIVDQRWDPPVTLGARLVSVISDDLQHVGQAAILRGIIERTGTS